MRQLTTASAGATSWEDEIIISNNLKKGLNNCLIEVQDDYTVHILPGSVVEADGVEWVCDTRSGTLDQSEFTDDGYITFSNGYFTLVNDPTDIVTGNFDTAKNGWYYNGARVVAFFDFSESTLALIKTKAGKQI